MKEFIIYDLMRIKQCLLMTVGQGRALLVIGIYITYHSHYLHQPLCSAQTVGHALLVGSGAFYRACMEREGAVYV